MGTMVEERAAHTSETPLPPMPRTRSPLARLVPIALVLAGIMLVALIALMPAPKPETAAPSVPPVNVEVLRIAPVAEMADAFDLTAVIEPERVVKVAAEVAGRIERVAARTRDVTWHGRTLTAGSVLAEGEPVTAGVPLLYLNTDLLQARHDRALAQNEFDAREAVRIEGLAAAGNSTRTELEDARTRLKVSKASLDEAARELERATIVAPTSGILNRLPVELGEYASPGTVVAEIVELDTVKIAVDVPERDVGYLQVGKPAEVRLPNGGEPEHVTGTITYISALADDDTRTTRVEITVPNPEHRLRSGQIVTARLTRRVLRDVLMVPLAAVIPLEEGREVYVVQDGKAERRPVELGFIKGRDVRVLSGLAPGDLLIVSGHRYVGPGQAVAVQNGG